MAVQELAGGAGSGPASVGEQVRSARAALERADGAGAGAGVCVGSTCAVEQQHVQVRCWVTGERHKRRARALAVSGAGPGRWASAGVCLRLRVSTRDAGTGVGASTALMQAA
jgi:hypothetical protein